jgi:hypothetical protein
MAELRVQVLAVDIAQGRRVDPEACPVAHAVRRAVDEAGYDDRGRTCVYGDFVHIGSWTRPLPWRARQFVFAFDVHGVVLRAIWRRLFVRPFTFTLELP